MAKPFKRFPLIPDAEAEINALCTAAWSALNGKRFTREHVNRVALLLSEMQHYAKYGRAGECPAALHHGPGHQSRSECSRPVGHAGLHRAEGAQWRGLTRFSGYFDELPDDV